MNNAWYQDAIVSVYSRVKGMVLSELKTKYPNITVTDTDDNLDNPKFPTVYINAMQPYERGQDIEGTTINAMSITFQAEVYAKDRISANEVGCYVVEAFKSMKFTATMPTYDGSSKDVKRTVSRFQRIIGSGDIL